MGNNKKEKWFYFSLEQEPQTQVNHRDPIDLYPWEEEAKLVAVQRSEWPAISLAALLSINLMNRA